MKVTFDLKIWPSMGLSLQWYYRRRSTQDNDNNNDTHHK
jgi:hypothetical protein